jgi:hypothetical protein
MATANDEILHVARAWHLALALMNWWMATLVARLPQVQAAGSGGQMVWGPELVVARSVGLRLVRGGS